MNALSDDFRRKSDPEARDRLLSTHLRLVHHVARRMKHLAHSSVELDDLVSAGTVGLIQAVESFDHERGIAFSTYAASRIRGAILDDLRRWDAAPRSVRRHQRLLSSAEQELHGSLSREPTAQEKAERLGVDVTTLHRWQNAAREASTVSLDAPAATSGGHAYTAAETIAGTVGEDIEEGINRGQELELLQEEIAQLNQQERTVLALYYFEELKLHQIAKVLDVTESRVSQIRSKALRTLRTRVAFLRED